MSKDQCLHPRDREPQMPRNGAPTHPVLCAREAGHAGQHHYAVFPAKPTIQGELVPPDLEDDTKPPDGVTFTAPRTGRYSFGPPEGFEHLQPTIAESIDAAAGPLKRLGAVTAQLDLATIPADAACCCLCSIYEPHTCDGWRADDCVRTIPSRKLLGFQPPPTEVPTCRSCFGVKPRQG